jgi:hypothetical protein
VRRYPVICSLFAFPMLSGGNRQTEKKGRGAARREDRPSAERRLNKTVAPPSAVVQSNRAAKSLRLQSFAIQRSVIRNLQCRTNKPGPIGPDRKAIIECSGIKQQKPRKCSENWKWNTAETVNKLWIWLSSVRNSTSAHSHEIRTRVGALSPREISPIETGEGEEREGIIRSNFVER